MNYPSESSSSSESESEYTFGGSYSGEEPEYEYKFSDPYYGEEIPLEPFELKNLPYDMIYNICDQMDTQTLGRFRASGRVGQICTAILNKRLLKSTENKIFNLNYQSSGEPSLKLIKRLLGKCIVKIRPMNDRERSITGVYPRKGYTDLVLELSDGSIVYYNLVRSVSVLLS